MARRVTSTLVANLRTLGVCLLLGTLPRPTAADDRAMLASWMAAQTNLQSWSADLVQIRTFKSLAQPLQAAGRVWFAAPNRFRWELGKPAQTIAIRQDDRLLVIYPRLKRVEQFSLTGGKGGSWRDALALLEAGFPRSLEDLERQFSISTQTITNGVCKLDLQPKSSSARRMIPRILIEFSTEKLLLTATELTFADGSSMRNEFSNQTNNPPVEKSMFSYEIPPEFKVVDPLAR